MTAKLSILVTGVGGGGLGEQIVKALRLSELNLEIIGTDITNYSTGSSLVDHFYVVERATNLDYIPMLLRICNKHNVKAIFYGSEAELKVFSTYKDKIENNGIFLPINSQDVLDICLDKVKTISFLKKNNFNYPKFAEISDIAKLDSFYSYPAIIKPTVGGGGSSMVSIAQNKEEASFLANQLISIYGRFIIQEYIGTPDDEYTVGILFDMDGNLVNSIALKRNLNLSLSNKIKLPNNSGKKELGDFLVISSGISQGHIGFYSDIQKQCEDIAIKLGAKSSINIQCRLKDDQVFPFEINPRFSGTTSLRAMVGFNEPEILIKIHLLNEKVPKYFKYSNATINRYLSEVLWKDKN
jgi:carbamoyl-phosphate synthase large subunit